MFIKPFHIKSNSLIKNSERKKLCLMLDRLFPLLTSHGGLSFHSKDIEVGQMKIKCHNGNLVLCHTIDRDPVLFEYRKAIYPTLYALWKCPGCIPVLQIGEPVLGFLQNGADLMAPGVIVDAGDADLVKKLMARDIVAICIVDNPNPVAVGQMLVNGDTLLDSNRQGKAVQIHHVYGDCLWSHGSKLELPTSLPENVERIPDVVAENVPEFSVDNVANNMDELRISDCDNNKNNNDDDVVVDSTDNHATDDSQQDDAADTDTRPLSERMDELLNEAFFTAVKLGRKEITFPILASIFYGNSVLHCVPVGMTLDVKKSSFKKFTVYLESLKSDGVIKIEKDKKGIISITEVCYNHERLVEHEIKPEYMPRPLEENDSAKLQYKMPTIRQVWVVTATVLPLFKGVSKGHVVGLEEVRAAVKKYVVEHQLQSSTDKSMVNLDPVLAQIVLTKGENMVLAMTWEQLNRRVLSKLSAATEIAAENKTPILKKGALDFLQLSVATRTGNKKVTLVSGFETFFIDPVQFARQIQTGVSASTCITDTPRGAKQVQIQGNQIVYIAKLLLDVYKIPRHYVRGLENAPKEKKGK